MEGKASGFPHFFALSLCSDSRISVTGFRTRVFKNLPNEKAFYPEEIIRHHSLNFPGCVVIAWFAALLDKCTQECQFLANP
jgi:hypothetical protein